MSKERLEEANKWLVRIKSLSTTKSNKEDAEYVNKHAGILEGLIEQNQRYREALEFINEELELVLHSNKGLAEKMFYIENSKRKITEVLESESE